MTTQYDEFAGDYEWLFADEGLTGERAFGNSEALLERFGTSAEILDCACGTGTLALALARHGYRVAGTDASGGMIEEARRRAGEAGLAIEFEACRWDELAGRFARRFDLVLCRGNSIGHCRDEAEMVRSLEGMREVMKDGGTLVVDSRNWEKILAERERFTVMRSKERGSRRCVPLYVWSIPADWHERLTIEVVLIFEEGGETSVRSHAITYYPFRHEALMERLERVGFGEVETDYRAGAASYRVSAHWGGRRGGSLGGGD
ncbi:MAG: class I SAM-dependent methyltransferase [Phycisphaerae bacterium]|nr:class I SAM-dependent methyltransferase [Phycisphaerae bacterium]